MVERGKPEPEGTYTKVIAVGTVLLVVIGYFTFAVAAHWPPFSSTSSSAITSPSPAITSPAASAPGTTTSSETRPTIYYQGTITIAGNGRDFDTNPPSPGPGTGAFYYNSSALETGGSNTVGLAVWRQGGTPTAAECKTFAAANLISDVPNVNAGMKMCFKTDQGRFGLLSVQPGTSANELTAIVTVWNG